MIDEGNEGPHPRTRDATHQESSHGSAMTVLNNRLFSVTRFHGLEHEKEEIVKIYNRVKAEASSTRTRTEFILIRGAPGTGRFSLTEKFLSPMVKQDGGYCVTVTFDQLMQLQKPHLAFVEAFTSYAEMVLERGDVDTIRAAVNNCENEIEGVDVLLKMIPALARVIGPAPDCMIGGEEPIASDEPPQVFGSYSSMEATSRFKYAFRLFLRAIASKNRPLILVMEHLHWADEAALDLLQTLISDTSNQATLFVATDRDDLETRKVTNMLKKLHALEVTVTHFHLKNLDEESTTSMIADILQIDPSFATPIASLVFSRTKGNRYFIELFLQALVGGDFLRYNGEVSPRWSCDTDEIRVEFGDTIADAVKANISRLPDDVLKTLRYASCLGSKLDEDILGHLTGKTPSVVASCLDLAATMGLLIHPPGTQRGWMFASNPIQDATLGLIPNDELEDFHYRIGRRLWRCFNLEELDENIFVVVGQLMAGSKFILEERERIAVAKLCLRAGERSVYMSSFQSAFVYLVRGIELLGTQCWRDNYSLSLEMYNAAVEVAFCAGCFDDVHSFVGEVLMHAACFDDTLRAHAAKVYTLGSSGFGQEAIAYGLKVLLDLDESFPVRPNLLRIFIELQRIRRRLRARTSESLLRLPLMENGRKLAAMQILNQVFLYTFLHQQELAPLIGFRMVSLSLDFGLSATSCLGFVALGAILCG